MSDRDDMRDPGGPVDVDLAVQNGEDVAGAPTADELVAAERLRAAMDDGTLLGDADAPEDDLALVAALRAAWAPATLDDAEHAHVLEEACRTGEELALSAELRDALEGKASLPEIVVALRAAWAPAALDDAEHRPLVERALASAPLGANDLETTPRPRRLRVARVALVSTATLALAATVLLWIVSVPFSDEVPLARTRSTQPLFDEPFRAGEASARIDRIAMARTSDYRDNRFAMWGVR